MYAHGLARCIATITTAPAASSRTRKASAPAVVAAYALSHLSSLTEGALAQFSRTMCSVPPQSVRQW